jgi:hypothetical protein
MTERGSSDWYRQVGKAMSRRDRALAMQAHWQEKLAAAEQEFQELTTGTGEVPTEPTTE